MFVRNDKLIHIYGGPKSGKSLLMEDLFRTLYKKGEFD
jgi:hypothetical protein